MFRRYWDNPRVMAAGFSLAIGTAAITLALNGCGDGTGGAHNGLEEECRSNAPGPCVRGGSTVMPESNFATLINKYQEGKAEPAPWAGAWWPYTKNGIAAGVNGGGSPAGKYDAVRGAGPVQAQSWEVKHHGAGVPKVQSWWGHCNGWCAAAALFPEPRWTAKVNGITFGIADIKGLLSETGMAASADFFGERIDADNPSSPKYWDTVPDQFFLVLTNYMGANKKTVLIDRYTGSQVWNQPMAGYKFEYPKPADYKGQLQNGVYGIELTARIWWADDGVPADIQTPPFNFQEGDPTGAYAPPRTLKMELWLDGPVEFGSDGKIVKSGNVVVAREGEFIAGGKWLLGNGYYVDAWPDYMWVPYSVFHPEDPDQDYANPHVDIDWVTKHLMVEGGVDDPTASPRPIVPAPSPSPSPNPTSSPVPTPVPRPTWTTTPRPTGTPTSTPRPTRTAVLQ